MDALWRRLLAEYLGSALLAAVVVGSGIAAQTLSPRASGLELLESAVATAAGLFAIILMFGAVSGAHFNPVVSFVEASFGGISWRTAALYASAQITGCISGAILANLMYAKPAVYLSTHDRATSAHFLSEVVATAGLVLVIFALVRTRRTSLAAAAVGAYIGAAYLFTSSTSFANPAIAVGRMFSNSFAGIAPSSVPPFIAAEVLGGLVAVALIRVLYPGLSHEDAARAVIPHGADARTEARTRTPTILFLCVHNAGRSQMAAGFARLYGAVTVLCAGSEPASSLNPAVVEAMRERGIDLEGESPQRLTDEMARAADVVVTMGCGDACPVYPGKQYVEWELDDPAGRVLEDVRVIRDEIERRVNGLISALRSSGQAGARTSGPRGAGT